MPEPAAGKRGPAGGARPERAAGGFAPVCRPAGDRHLTLELGGDVDSATNELVYRTEAILLALNPPGLRETVPAYSSLLLRFDPLATGHEAMARVVLEAVAAAARSAGGEAAGRTAGPGDPRPGGSRGPVLVPVVYGGEWGPDLEDVARHTGLDPEEVVRRHVAASYQVFALGFAPGFAYLGGMDRALATPRRSTPRPHVPAGSVGVAGEQTGVYPADLPGGWNIIGRTPLRLWRPAKADPAVLGPGTGVRFLDAGRGEEGWARALALAAREEARLARTGQGGVGEGSRSGPEEGATEERARPGGVAVARVLAAGPFDTVQDAGRWGWARVGVPESGPLDWPGLAEANLAAGNAPGAAAVEATYGGLKLEFVRRATVAVSAGASVRLNGRRLEAGRAAVAQPGDRLEIGPGRYPRSYLAFAGGLDVPVTLGSQSTYTPAGLGGLGGRPLRAGDVLRGWPGLAAGESGSLPEATGPAASPERLGWLEPAAPAEQWGWPERSGRPASGTPTVVRAVPGPDDERFSAEVLRAFFGRTWCVLPSSDRRASLLEGEPLAAPGGSGVSGGCPAGTVQVPPSGLPAVLLADHQTIGGYPRIATVIGPDLPLLGRVWPGEFVRFVPVTASQARGVWFAMPERTARAWPGNAGKARPAGWVVRLNLTTPGLGGRSVLVSVEPSPPR